MNFTEVHLNGSSFNYDLEFLWRRNLASLLEGLECAVEFGLRMDAATARCECPRAMCSSTFIDEMDRTDAYHFSAGFRMSVGVARQKSMDGLKHTEPEQP